MIDIAKIKVGEKVHYTYNNDPSTFENGIVKEIPQEATMSVRVVYHCGGDWENYKEYTSALTLIEHLKMGWHHDEI